MARILMAPQGSTQRISRLSRTVNITEAATENKIMARQPGPPPRGRTRMRVFLGTAAQVRGSLSCS